MRVLVVSPYPPRPDGIGIYARAQVERLRAAGDVVDVLSPPDGAGDVRVGFLGGRPFRRAARLAPGYERVLVHFQPSLYYRPRAPLSKIATSLALLSLVLRRPQTELVVHEADPPALWRPDYLLLALAFRAVSRVWIHTDTERRSLERAYRVRVRGATTAHTEGVRVEARLDRAEARRRLGVPEEGAVFLCPGFLHPDKGYERAIQALAELRADGAPDARLYVVGSVRDPKPANVSYASRLRALCRATPGAELREAFADDREFDAWVDAADAVVLPYRRSWSSGALARAQVHGTPAIVSRVGGLAEQAGPDDEVFGTDAELRNAMLRRAAGVRPGRGGGAARKTTRRATAPAGKETA